MGRCRPIGGRQNERVEAAGGWGAQLWSSGGGCLEPAADCCPLWAGRGRTSPALTLWTLGRTADTPPPPWRKDGPAGSSLCSRCPVLAEPLASSSNGNTKAQDSYNAVFVYRKEERRHVALWHSTTTRHETLKYMTSAWERCHARCTSAKRTVVSHIFINEAFHTGPRGGNVTDARSSANLMTPAAFVNVIFKSSQSAFWSTRCHHCCELLSEHFFFFGLRGN